MSKKLVHELTYDAPMEQVQAMLADPAFRERVCDAQHVLSRTVTVEKTADGLDVTVDQVQPATGLPGFAKKLVGSEINIVQRESWNGEQAMVSVTIPGKPGEMTGTATLAESGGTTTETVELTVKVNIPLVAGRVESLVADMLLKALKTENRVGREWLAG